MRIRVKDLDPLHSPETSGRRPNLEKLSDDELLEAANNPSNGQRISINKRTGKLAQGNGRAYELKKRAADPNSKINDNTEITIEIYDPVVESFFSEPDR